MVEANENERLREALERARNTLWLSHYYWLAAAKEALQGDLGKLRKHVAISEGMRRETVLDDINNRAVNAAIAARATLQSIKDQGNG